MVQRGIDIFSGIFCSVLSAETDWFWRLADSCPKNFKLYGPFLWMGFNCFKARATRGSSLLFTTKFPDIPGTHFIDLGRMKGWVDLVVSFSENFMEHVNGPLVECWLRNIPRNNTFLERQKKRARWSKSSVKTYNCLYKYRTIPQSSLSLDTRHQHQTKSSLMSRLPPGGYGKNWARIIFTLRLIKMFYF